MSITPSSPIVTTDFISASDATSGKVPKTLSDGKLDRSFIRGSFGGTGADGALTVTSGTTTIDLAGAKIVVKNYTSISITGTGAVAFSNPHVSGTIIIFKSQGNVTLTSSATPMLDLRSIGASAGNTGFTTLGYITATTDGANGSTNGSATNAAGVVGAPPITLQTDIHQFGVAAKVIHLSVGTAGSTGGTGYQAGGTAGAGGAGSRGAGAMLIECAGAWNFTTASGIHVGSPNATAGTNGTGTGAGGGGGGGSGAGGTFVALYNTLTANSGTVTIAAGTAGTYGNKGASTVNISGGAGGSGGSNIYGAGTTGSSTASVNSNASNGDGGAGGAGKTGVSYIAANADFV